MRELFTITLFVFACAGNIFSQQIRFQSQKPHANEVKAMTFARDSKSVVTADEAGEIIVWAVPNGNIIRHITNRQVPVTSICFSPDGKILVAAGQEYNSDHSEITAWQWPSGKKLFSVTRKYISHITFKPDGEGFYGVGYCDNSEKEGVVCVQFDMNGKQLKESIYDCPETKILLLRLSPDATKMGVLTGEYSERHILIIDLKKETASPVYTNQLATDLDIQNNGTWTIAYVTSEGQFSEAYNTEKEEFEEVPTVNSKSFMMEGSNTNFHLYSPLTDKVKKLSMPEEYNFLKLREWTASPDGKFATLMLGYGASGSKYQGITFWNASNGKFIFGAECAFSPIYSIDSYYDSKLVFSKRGPIEVWDPSRLDVYSEFPGGTEECYRLYTDKKSYSVFTYQYDNGHYGSLVNPGNASVETFNEDLTYMLSVSKDFTLGAYIDFDTENRNMVHFFDPVTLREKGSYNGRAPLHGVSVSTDGKLCAIVRSVKDSSVVVELVETFTKKAKTAFSIKMNEGGFMNAQTMGLVFSDDGKTLVINTNSHTYIYDTRLEAITTEFEFAARRNCFNPVAMHPKSKMIAIAARNGELNLFGATTGKSMGTLPGANGNIAGMVFLPDGKILTVGYEDGSVRLFDTDKNVLIATFLGLSAGDYLLYTPDGYYTGTGKGLNMAGFYQGETYINRLTLDKKYNCPDTVMARIGLATSKLLKIYGTARAKRLQRSPDKTMGQISPARPVVEITGKSELPYFAESNSIGIKIAARDTSSGLSLLKIYQNGVLVHSQPLQGKSTIVSYKLDLVTDNNKFEMVVENAAGAESSYETFETYWKTTQSTTPELYILAVGVSKFADKERNLDFAAKDATEIVEALEQSPAFSKVNKMLITDKEATLANFEKQAAFLQKAKPGDVVIIYFSTHGVLDEKMDYYLATHDMEFANPQGKGIPYYKLEEMLSKLSCRNRMIIMDACHSGEVDKEDATLVMEKKDNPSTVTAKSGAFSIQPKLGLKNSFAYMHALFDDASRSTGTHIIGAASGYQVALESGEWSNGAFTYALKAGLTLKAADLDKDGNVNVAELQTYLQKTVSQLTNGEQTPALRSVNRDNDFRLW